MTNYSFEPVSIPHAEDLGSVEDLEEGPSTEGPVSPDAIDPETVQAEQEHLHEITTKPSELARRSERNEAPPSGEPRPDRIEAVRAEAHRQGVEEGRRAEAERVRTALEAVRSVVDEMHRTDERRENEAGQRVAALAVAIAAHLLEREVRVSPDVVSDLVRRAIAEFPLTDSLKVHLSPGDLTLLSRGIGGESAQPQLTSGQSVRWVPDPEIRPGGCLVEGGDRVVDARLSTILERVFRVLVDG